MRNFKDERIIRRELERLIADDPTTHDLETVDADLAKLEQRQANLVRGMAQMSNAEALAAVSAELDNTGARIGQLRTEREDVLNRRAAWLSALERLDDLALWHGRVARTSTRSIMMAGVRPSKRWESRCGYGRASTRPAMT